MILLFTPDAELSVLPFLAAHAGEVGIVAPLADLEALPEAVYAPGAAGFVGPLDNVDLVLLDEGTPAALAAKGTDKLWIVAASGGEGRALEELRGACPDHRFAGLGEALFPALVNRAPGAVLKGMAKRAPTRRITLIFAPPRSGSSFVADVLGHVTGSKTREHLRGEVIEVLASPYLFNRAAAVRNFLSLVTGPTGEASTKIISHFLQDYIAKVGDLRIVRRAFEGIAVKVIVLDRADKVAQTVSGYLAARRGLWHLEHGPDDARLEAVREVGYDFSRLLPRYLGYRHQTYVLDLAREIFPEHLSLEYGADVEAGDAAALGVKIAAYLGLDWTPDPEATKRAKLANAENDRLCARFREDYQEILGAAP